MIRDMTLRATDGAALYGWFREPAGAPPSAIIAHVHGMGEHSRRYDHVTAYWESIGWASAGFDLRGHGRSEGPRGHAPSYAQLMDDITTLLDAVNARWPGVPIVLYGHSLGGGLVLNHAVRKRPAVTRVVATAPYLRLVDGPGIALVWAVKLASHIAPAVSLATGLDITALSRDQAVVQRYRDDPLVHDRMTFGFFANVHDACEGVIRRGPELHVPTLVMHGSADRITSPLASKELVENSDGRATLRLWDGYYHEIHNDPSWDDVLLFTRRWIESDDSIASALSASSTL
jgi:alpha-beta hydrolase superfamily lysophospholipase